MIKNVVFDLGNVLISFNPSEYLLKNNYPLSVRNIILSDIFGSQKWLLLDDGKITTPEATEAIARKSSLKSEVIARIFNERTKIFYSLDDNAGIFPVLKKQDFKLYYISNFPADIFDEVRNDYELFKYFDGGIISAEVKCSKPDKKIFKIFFEKYNLVPEECFYIDDTEKNVIAAESLGMKSFFTAGSPDISKDLFEILPRL